MSNYRIFLTSTASASVQVEAETLEDAQELAYNETPSLCAQCSGWGMRWSRDEGEWEVDESSYVVDGEYVEVKP